MIRPHPSNLSSKTRTCTTTSKKSGFLQVDIYVTHGKTSVFSGFELLQKMQQLNSRTTQ